MTSPLFFGSSPQRLFGVYHPPFGHGQSDRAVLLCPPAPQEYMLTHWAMRRLASLLARAGAHVLRFDYFGTGDSAGGNEEGSLEIWQENVLVAERKLRELSGASRISLVGYRMGATLAWRASRLTETKPRDLVLWDPIVSGKSYIRDLIVADACFNSRLLYFPTPTEPPQELSGFTLSASQYQATVAVDALSEPLPNAVRAHLYVGLETPDNRALASRLEAELRRFSYACVLENGAKGSGSLLSTRILAAISGALSPEEP